MPMKAKLLLCCFIFTQFCLAQNIIFPDSVFKDYLLIAKTNFNTDPNVFIQYPPIDANADGQISYAEALLVEGFDFGYANITNLEGLQYFTNVKVISTYFADFPNFYQPSLINLEQLSLLNSVGTSSLSSVNVSQNSNLKKFECRSDLITNLDFSSNPQLRDLSIYCPSLTSLNLSNLNNLKNLSYLGKLPTIDLSDANNLLTLNCVGSTQNFSFPNDNLLTALDLSNQTKLMRLDLTGNNITDLNLSNSPNLENLNISNNNITTLNIDNVKYVRQFFCDNNLLSSLDVSEMFNLNNFSCKNNQLTSLATQNGIIEEYIDFSGNPGLISVCCDANEVVYMQNLCNLYDYGTTQVNGNCGNQANRISMYPNPVGDWLHLSANFDIERVEVFNANGMLVMSSESGADAIEMNSLNSGLYFLKVFSSQEVNTLKFVKI
jgi:hypothetical protein